MSTVDLFPVVITIGAFVAVISYIMYECVRGVLE
jgi:hypothetical protein